MKTLLVLLCLTVAVDAIFKTTKNSGYDDDKPQYPPAKGGTYKGKSYPPKYPPASHGKGGGILTDLDKLYEIVADTLAKIKGLSEQVEAVSAALSIQEKKLNSLELMIVEFEETDHRQNKSIDKLHKHLDNVLYDAGSLLKHIVKLKEHNWLNTNKTEEVENKWAWLQKNNIKQDGYFHYLYAFVKDLKPKLFQVKDNKFGLFYDKVERDTTTLTSVKTFELRRMCEVGQVTIRAGENRVDYQYQTWFDNVPQILYGLAGYNFDLDTREDPPYYGYGYPPKEPEAIGVFVTAYSTKTGIVFTALDTGYGDTSLVSMDVAFQACTIGPGKGKIDH
ncbi:uncharacterized protein LOC143292672 isoform X1 [Babylonia areolata]|uniref:uncharacterized protein LOC143292672 isoform X1 n=1 Tax=Babylonia areolata TaxID=304850 RepID=UPI003FCF7CE0